MPAARFVTHSFLSKPFCLFILFPFVGARSLGVFGGLVVVCLSPGKFDFWSVLLGSGVGSLLSFLSIKKRRVNGFLSLLSAPAVPAVPAVCADFPSSFYIRRVPKEVYGGHSFKVFKVFLSSVSQVFSSVSQVVKLLILFIFHFFI